MPRPAAKKRCVIALAPRPKEPQNTIRSRLLARRPDVHAAEICDLLPISHNPQPCALAPFFTDCSSCRPSGDRTQTLCLVPQQRNGVLRNYYCRLFHRGVISAIPPRRETYISNVRALTVVKTVFYFSWYSLFFSYFLAIFYSLICNKSRYLL